MTPAALRHEQTLRRGPEADLRIRAVSPDVMVFSAWSAPAGLAAPPGGQALGFSRSTQRPWPWGTRRDNPPSLVSDCASSRRDGELGSGWLDRLGRVFPKLTQDPGKLQCACPQVRLAVMRRADAGDVLGRVRSAFG